MSTKTRKLLQPQYISQFHCIGPACEDSCCIGWRVQIDKDTYQRYRDCSDNDLRPMMDEKVTRHRTNPTNFNYAKIKLNPDSHCPFIDEDKLCSIQRKLGEEYLSITCTTYPPYRQHHQWRNRKIPHYVLPRSSQAGIAKSCPNDLR